MNALAKHREEVEFFRINPGVAFDEGTSVAEFQVENWQSFLPELKAMIPDHWKEIALDQDVIKLDPDWSQYELLDRQGMLHLVTARDDGWPIGYHISFIRPHMHYKNSLTCFGDIFYLRPEYRRGLTGYKMLKFFRDSVKAKGVQKIYIATKLKIDLGPLLRRLGFSQIEHIYATTFTS